MSRPIVVYLYLCFVLTSSLFLFFLQSHPLLFLAFHFKPPFLFFLSLCQNSFHFYCLSFSIFFLPSLSINLSSIFFLPLPLASQSFSLSALSCSFHSCSLTSSDTHYSPHSLSLYLCLTLSFFLLLSPSLSLSVSLHSLGI